MLWVGSGCARRGEPRSRLLPGPGGSCRPGDGAEGSGRCGKRGCRGGSPVGGGPEGGRGAENCLGRSGGESGCMMLIGLADEVCQVRVRQPSDFQAVMEVLLHLSPWTPLATGPLWGLVFF